MKKISRALVLILSLALIGGMLSFAAAETVTLSVTLTGEREQPDGTVTRKALEGSFRVFQNGREMGNIKAGETVLQLDSGERIRIEPRPETIEAGWDLSSAYVDIAKAKNGANAIEITVKAIAGEAASVKPVAQTTPAADEENAGTATETTTGTVTVASVTGTQTETEVPDNHVAAVASYSTPTLGPTPEPTPTPTPEPDLPGIGGGTGTLHVKIFHDRNGNGEQGPYEPASPVDVRVYLLDAEGYPLDRRDVAAGREAVFENLPEGSYHVKVYLPDRWCFSRSGKSDSGTSNCMELTPDGWCTSGIIRVRDVVDQTIGVGILEGVQVSGYCWLENTSDGVHQDGEQKLPGVKIKLGAQKLELEYETTSDSEGNWKLDRVFPAYYGLTVFVPEGMMFTRYSSTGGHSRSILTKEGVTKATKALDVSDGSSKMQENIGFVWAAGLEGMCFQDANYNGLYDEGELPMKGVKVVLIKPAGDEVLATVTSGEDGRYKIPSLRGNTYRVRVVLPDDGSDFTKKVSDPKGNQLAARENRRENYLTDFVISDMQTRELNIGVIYYSTIKGTVYMDRDFSGTRSESEKIVSGFLVTLLNDKGNAYASDKTNINGMYEITRVVPGEYTLKVNAVDGYAFTKQGEDNVILNRNRGEGYSNPFRVELGKDISGMDIGMILPGTVRGLVFADLNDNGTRDAGENGLAGTVVRLMSEEGEAFSATIGADGGFLFDAVMPGRYQLEYQLPEGAIFARIPNSISGGNVITGTDGTGRGDWFEFTAGQTVDAPLCGGLTLGTISGTAFEDHNGNGVIDAGEEMLSGVSLELIPERRDLEPLKSVTGEDGRFLIPEIHPDTYTLQVEGPDGYVISRADALALPLKAGTADQEAVLEIPMGETMTDQLLGYVIPAGLQGFLWLDENDNGIYDEGEQTPAGYRLTVVDESTGAVFDELTTDGSGVFSTEGMIPGRFAVTMALDGDTAAAREGRSTFRQDGESMVMTGIELKESDLRNDLALGIRRYTSISGTIWMDRGGSVEPLANASITLNDENGNALQTMETGADGQYRFGKLLPGTYMLEADMPEGSVVVEPGDSRLAAGYVSIMTTTNSRHGESDPIELVMGQDLTGLDVGCVLPGTLGDLCWLDENGDGLQGMFEYGIPGVIIELVRDGETVMTTESDQYGFYRFSDIYPAEYTLRVTPPEEVKPTVQGAKPHIISSVLEETDDDVSVTGEIQVESDRANYNVDLGFVCRREGVRPSGYGEGETQNWSKQQAD